MKSYQVIFSVPSVHYPFREFGNERHLSIDEWKKILNSFIADFKEYNFNWYSIGHVVKNLFRREPSSLCVIVKEK